MSGCLDKGIFIYWKKQVKEKIETGQVIKFTHPKSGFYRINYEKYPNNPMITYERIRTMYKHIMKRGDFHEIALQCGVHFDNSSKPDYNKEKGSVEKISKLKKGL